MELRVFNEHIELDGQPIAKICTGVHEYTVRDALAQHEGSYEPECDCDPEAAASEGYESGASEREAEILGETFDKISDMVSDKEIDVALANRVLKKLGVKDEITE